MTIRYVDPAAPGPTHDGSSWNDAWTDLQDAADTAVGGDVVKCRGTQTLTVPIDFDTSSGDANGFIKFIGCNGSGDIDGTRFVLDGDNTAAICFRNNSEGFPYPNRLWFENLEAKNATGRGVESNNGSNSWWTFVNCISHDNGGDGFYMWNIQFVTFVKCKSYNNSGRGWNMDDSTTFIACTAYGNTSQGLYAYESANAMNSVFYDNSSSGFQAWKLSHLFNSVLDGNSGAGIYGEDLQAEAWHAFFNRTTNNNYGIDFNGTTIVCGWNYFHNNITADLANPGAWSEVGIEAAYITDEGTANTNLSDIDGDDGYANAAGLNFNLRVDRTYNGDGDEIIGLNIGS